MTPVTNIHDDLVVTYLVGISIQIQLFLAVLDLDSLLLGIGKNKFGKVIDDSKDEHQAEENHKDSEHTSRLHRNVKTFREKEVELTSVVG